MTVKSVLPQFHGLRDEERDKKPCDHQAKDSIGNTFRSVANSWREEWKLPVFHCCCSYTWYGLLMLRTLRKIQRNQTSLQRHLTALESVKKLRSQMMNLPTWLTFASVWGLITSFVATHCSLPVAWQNAAYTWVSHVLPVAVVWMILWNTSKVLLLVVIKFEFAVVLTWHTQHKTTSSKYVVERKRENHI